MTIKKLQKVATTHVDASFKAKWLRWWNFFAEVKIKNQFSSALPLCEKVLDDWLNNVFFLGTSTSSSFVFLVCFFYFFPFLTIGLS